MSESPEPVEVSQKRLFIGGLAEGVKCEELTQRFSSFGTVKGIEIKVRKDQNGTPVKTFAYIDLESSDASLKKCITTYNKTKWKGSELRIEVAKDNFMERLKEERMMQLQGEIETEKKEPPTPATGIQSKLMAISDFSTTANFQMKGAPPGTTIPGQENWVVGKYGRVLPIVNMKQTGTKKIVKIDPSKLTHNLRKINEKKEEDYESIKPDNLTWEMEEEDNDLTRKRKGEFPERKPPKSRRMFYEHSGDNVEDLQKRLLEVVNSEQVYRSSEFEVVPVQKTGGGVGKSRQDRESSLINSKDLAKFDSDSEEKIAKTDAVDGYIDLSRFNSDSEDELTHTKLVVSRKEQREITKGNAKSISPSSHKTSVSVNDKSSSHKSSLKSNEKQINNKKILRSRTDDIKLGLNIVDEYSSGLNGNIDVSVNKNTADSYLEEEVSEPSDNDDDSDFESFVKKAMKKLDSKQPVVSRSNENRTEINQTVGVIEDVSEFPSNKSYNVEQEREFKNVTGCVDGKPKLVEGKKKLKVFQGTKSLLTKSDNDKSNNHEEDLVESNTSTMVKQGAYTSQVLPKDSATMSKQKTGANQEVTKDSGTMIKQKTGANKAVTKDPGTMNKQKTGANQSMTKDSSIKMQTKEMQIKPMFKQTSTLNESKILVAKKLLVDEFSSGFQGIEQPKSHSDIEIDSDEEDDSDFELYVKKQTKQMESKSVEKNSSVSKKDLIQMNMKGIDNDVISTNEKSNRKCEYNSDSDGGNNEMLKNNVELNKVNKTVLKTISQVNSEKPGKILEPRTDNSVSKTLKEFVEDKRNIVAANIDDDDDEGDDDDEEEEVDDESDKAYENESSDAEDMDVFDNNDTLDNESDSSDDFKALVNQAVLEVQGLDNTVSKSKSYLKQDTVTSLKPGSLSDEKIPTGSDSSLSPGSLKETISVSKTQTSNIITTDKKLNHEENSIDDDDTSDDDDNDDDDDDDNNYDTSDNENRHNMTKNKVKRRSNERSTVTNISGVNESTTKQTIYSENILLNKQKKIESSEEDEDSSDSPIDDDDNDDKNSHHQEDVCVTESLESEKSVKEKSQIKPLKTVDNIAKMKTVDKSKSDDDNESDSDTSTTSESDTSGTSDSDSSVSETEIKGVQKKNVKSQKIKEYNTTKALSTVKNSSNDFHNEDNIERKQEVSRKSDVRKQTASQVPLPKVCDKDVKENNVVTRNLKPVGKEDESTRRGKVDGATSYKAGKVVGVTSYKVDKVAGVMNKADKVAGVMNKADKVAGVMNKADKMAGVMNKADTDKKRLEAVKQRQKETKARMSAIKTALSDLDKGKTMNTKIVFNSDSEEELIAAEVNKRQPMKTVTAKQQKNLGGSEENSGSRSKSLFDSSDDDDSDREDDQARFNIREEFEGVEGRKLAKLQSRYGNDERFRLDARFIDSGSDSDRDEEEVKMEEDERTRSLKILQSVVGAKAIGSIMKQDKAKKQFKDMSSLKYDPSKVEHQQFEVKTVPKEPAEKKDTKKKIEIEEEVEEVPEVVVPEVSKERFFEVSESLKNTFVNKTQGDAPAGCGFSLLAAFGRHYSDDDEEALSDDDVAIPIPETLRTNQLSLDNRFRVTEDDGSSESEEESDLDQSDEDEGKAELQKMETTATVAEAAVTKPPTSFFFTQNDGRLKEGQQFCRKEDMRKVREKWQEKRQHFIDSYKTKHKNFKRKHKNMMRSRKQHGRRNR